MHDERQNMLANEKIGKLLWKLSLPAGIGMFVMTLYNVVDTIFIGHAVGSLGIAGLTIVFPFQMLAMGLGMMIGIGGAVGKMFRMYAKDGADLIVGDKLKDNDSEAEYKIIAVTEPAGLGNFVHLECIIEKTK